MHIPASSAFCRATVLAPGRRVDLALPCDVPVAELIPLVLELLGEPGRAPRGPVPGASARSPAVAPAGATLGELGVWTARRSGSGPRRLPRRHPSSTTRWRRGGAPAPATARRSSSGVAGRHAGRRRAAGDRPDGGNGAETVRGASARRCRRHRRARAGGPGRPPHPGRGRRRRVRRAPSPSSGARTIPNPRAPGPLALVPARCAVPLAAAAGWAALPGPPGASRLLLAVAAGASPPRSARSPSGRWPRRWSPRSWSRCWPARRGGRACASTSASPPCSPRRGGRARGRPAATARRAAVVRPAQARRRHGRRRAGRRGHGPGRASAH